MKILLHTCCGPCAIYPVQYFKERGIDVYGYFYNPNIHPYTEFARRRDTLDQYAKETGLNMIFEQEYPLEKFLQGVAFREANRCRFCYSMRLERAAGVAKKGGFDCFGTTLLVSPYQKHDLIREIGEAIGEEYGVLFKYVDFRPGYREATIRSRALGMYRQQYCGCIYSEKDRYYRDQAKRKNQKSKLE